MKSLFNKISLWIFPRRCELCGEVVELDEARCNNCRNAKRIGEMPCPKCGRDKVRCQCNQNRTSYKAVVAPFYYESSLVSALHNFKFNGFCELGEFMSTEMLDCIKREYAEINFDAVCYVPLSKKREKARGYNQSLILADFVSKGLNVPLEHTLYKCYETTSQRTLRGRQRKQNVFATFDLCENVDVENKTYLVIDDVKTTGSTLNEVSATLKAYGAIEVYCATFAIR